MLNKRYEQIELTNMCMIYDNEGNVVVQDKIGKSWGGLTFPGGHVEKGESFVDSVIREVKEETGLDIKNITYFGNEPWPYPSGLMVGFIADYAGGEISLQDEELSSGAFYTRENLPELPHKLSLARKMIAWWIKNN